MEIKWLGHSCFLITTEAGTRVITDPFDKKVGYRTPNVKADLVVCSHHHYDHDAVGEVLGSPAVIDKPGMHEFKDLKITGIPTFHDQAGGKQRGENIIFVFEADGIRVAHCGDLGHLLTAQQVQALGRVDILLVPTGGYYTIDAREAAEVVKQLNPKAVIPMHYKTKVMNFPITGVDEFLKVMGKGKRVGTSSIAFNPRNLPGKTQIFVLEYPQ